MFGKKSKPSARIPQPQAPQPQTPQPPVARFFRCDNEANIGPGDDLGWLKCLSPIPMNKMLYGCYLCDNPKLTLYDELPHETRTRFPANLSAIWSTPVPCHDHPNLYLLPHCPTCKVIIDRDGWSPPIGIWGASKAGKTVYCASLMVEIDSHLYDWTGMTAIHFHNERKYKEEVGDKFKINGIIPGKTKPDDRRTLVLKLRGDGWRNRKLALTDLAGETYEDWLSLGDEDAKLRARRALILDTKESIFIADPEASPGLRSMVRRDLYPALQEIGLVYTQFKLLDHYEHYQKQILLSRMKHALSTHNYPVANDPDPLLSSGSAYTIAEQMNHQVDGDPIGTLLKKFEYHPYGSLAVELALLVHDTPHESLVSKIAERLNFASIKMNAVPDLKSQIGGLAEFISRCGVDRVGEDKKLDRRLAIAVSKADLIPDVLKEYKRFPLNDPDFRPSKVEWREILSKISGISKQILIDFGERQFVELAEKKFRDVGFFFVSSCGRETEEFVKQEATAAPIPQATMYTSLGQEQQAAPARTDLNLLPLDKILTRGPRGGRQPDPQHVLLPLLWILAN